MLTRWLAERASTWERAAVELHADGPSPQPVAATRAVSVIVEEGGASVRAVLPLTALLGLVLALLLRDRPRYLDEVIFGIILALAGMALLTSGVRLGLTPPGDEIGRQLPRALQKVQPEGERIVIDNFDPTHVIRAVDTSGEARMFFHLVDGDRVRLVEYRPERYDPASGRYEHSEPGRPLFHPRWPLVGIAVVILFAFGMGYGSTLAEPALNALGRTVEDLTVGTVRRSAVIRAVSIGVGIGLVIGVVRILYDVPMTWLLLPPYLLLLPLTLLGEEEFTGIAWDCGGVTTGTVTVPLVLAMGMGLGGEVGMADGFGILAMASVYPVLTVQIFGLLMRRRQRRAIREAERGTGDE